MGFSVQLVGCRTATHKGSWLRPLSRSPLPGSWLSYWVCSGRITAARNWCATQTLPISPASRLSWD